MAELDVAGARCVALVGPYLSGKTSLLEAMLVAAGAISRKGNVRDGNTVGDSAPASRARQMSTELNTAHCEFMGDRWAILDCPGSIEFAQDARNALMAADIAVVVVEPDPAKASALAPTFHFLDEHQIPHLVFINKMDAALAGAEETIAALAEVSARPLMLRHLPIRDGERTTGYVDLISQRSYAYRQGDLSDVIEVPADLADERELARQDLLESLADFDDDLLEKLLEDLVPEQKDVYRDLTAGLADDRFVPVMLGAGEQQSGVFRLWKSLRHDTPHAATTAMRRGHVTGDGLCAEVFKTSSARTGKFSHARVWAGELTEGQTLGDVRLGQMYRLTGQEQEKVKAAVAGDVVALSRIEELRTGDVLNDAGRVPSPVWPRPLSPVFAMSVTPERRDDDVKLSSALARLVTDDPSYVVEHEPDTGELLLRGQGEIHLAVAADRLEEGHNVKVTLAPPRVAYKETIRKPVEQHARHKKQSGGHGQFGDVTVEISPLPRGAGFEFSSRVVGGAVPKQYIPSVETGVRNYLQEGPLGFPVVDVSVCLLDGQHHSVDSSDMAFQTAAQAAMREGMPKCGPVLLEPVFRVRIDVPGEHASKVNQVVTGRRGQLLGFDARADWPGWDSVEALLPQAGMADLIVELRSLSQGAATFEAAFDHLQELTGREAEQVVAQRTEAAQAA
ncbi:MAG: elongation factor G [Alphaproteobacteria bacterium]|nr:elongation factor G [Alphaproteobacteria bacterium]